MGPEITERIGVAALDDRVSFRREHAHLSGFLHAQTDRRPREPKAQATHIHCGGCRFPEEKRALPPWLQGLAQIL
jgi:hypothetical protein